MTTFTIYHGTAHTFSTFDYTMMHMTISAAPSSGINSSCTSSVRALSWSLP